MKTKSISLSLCGILFILIETILILLCGGFFEIVIAFALPVILLLFFYKGITVNLNLSQGIFFIFSVWYFVCALKGGFVIEYAIKGMLPFVTLLLWIYLSNVSFERAKIIDVLVEISMWIAVISVIHCIFISIDAGTVKRSTFPFDYSNASGIYFAVCYFYARHSKVKFLAKGKYIFIVSLLLTQSIGAIGVFALALVCELILEKRYKKLLLLTAAVLLLVLLLYNRIAESGGTFIERLLHMHDGILCIAENPVFGIGAGQWEIAKNYYQTGFYAAKTIHSSIISIGVSSGVVGLLLFISVAVLEIKKLLKSRSCIPALMIFIHSMFDFTLSFLAISVLLVLSLSYDEEKTVCVKPVCKNLTAAVILIFTAVLSAGLLNSAAYQKDVAMQKNSKVFEDNAFLQASVRAAQCYAAAMYTEKADGAIPFENYKYLSTEMILCNSLSEKDGYLTDEFRAQPYNTALRDYITNGSDAKIAEQASEISASAADKASYLGKIIYRLKGENK